MKKWIVSALGFAASLGAMCEPDDPNAPDLFRKCEPVYSGTVELLYWTVNEGGLDYALKMRHSAAGPSPLYAQGKAEVARYDLDPGFRIGLLYFRAPHYWELKWQYTRMNVSGKDSANKPRVDTKYLTGTWPQITAAPLASAKSALHFNYNIFDIIMTRVFIPNPHLKLRFVGTPTICWMDQEWNVQYRDAVGRGTDIKNRWGYIGAGLKMGASADWFMGSDIYLIGSGMFGGLLGSYTNTSKQTVNFAQQSGDHPEIPIRDLFLRDTRPAFTAQMLFGPSYQKNFACNRVEFFMGYEVNSWFNLQEIYRSTSGSATEAKQTWINSSVMALQGLTTRLTVDF
jgi:hypothetical protein